MTILSNYLYKLILNLVLNQIYNKQYKISLFTENDELKYQQNNNELINLSLISKNWFKIISNLLTKQILKFKNYQLLKSLVSTNNNEIYNNQDDCIVDENGNELFLKLIKFKNSIKIYDSFSEFLIDFNNNNNNNNKNNNFRKILINCSNYQESLSILESNEIINNNNENIKFNFTIKVGGKSELIDLNKFNENNKKINCIKIYQVQNYSGNSVGEYEKSYEIITKLKPKQIQFFPILDDFSRFYPIISKLFQCKSLKQFKYNSEYIEPFNLLSINSETSKLQYLSIPMMLREIIRYLNGRQEVPIYEFNKSTDTVFSEWKAMIKKVSSIKSLKQFTIDPNNYVDFEFNKKELFGPENLDLKSITYGIKLLLNQTKSIQILEFIQFDIIDNNIITGLVQNKTIHTLIFYYFNKDLNLIFNTVLPKNQLIRNLIFQYLNFNNLLIQLNKLLFNFNKINNKLLFNFNKINNNYNNDNNNYKMTLYSLTIHLVKDNINMDFISLLQKVLELSKYIKEIIIYFPFNFKDIQFKNNQIYNNGSIIKFYFEK